MQKFLPAVSIVISAATLLFTVGWYSAKFDTLKTTVEQGFEKVDKTYERKDVNAERWKTVDAIKSQLDEMSHSMFGTRSTPPKPITATGERFDK